MIFHKIFQMLMRFSFVWQGNIMYLINFSMGNLFVWKSLKIWQLWIEGWFRHCFFNKRQSTFWIWFWCFNISYLEYHCVTYARIWTHDFLAKDQNLQFFSLYLKTRILEYFLLCTFSMDINLLYTSMVTFQMKMINSK